MGVELAGWIIRAGCYAKAVIRREAPRAVAGSLLLLAVAVLLAQANLELAQSVLEQTDQLISLNRTRYQQGKVSELELTRIEVERLRFADEAFQARLEVSNAKAELLGLLYAPDLDNEVVHIPDSKTPGGIADVPIAPEAKKAIKAQWKESGVSLYLFPATTSGGSKPHLSNVNKAWTATLQRAKVPHFSLYELRHTFATRPARVASPTTSSRKRSGKTTPPCSNARAKRSYRCSAKPSTGSTGKRTNTPRVLEQQPGTDRFLEQF